MDTKTILTLSPYSSAAYHQKSVNCHNKTERNLNLWRNQSIAFTMFSLQLSFHLHYWRLQLDNLKETFYKCSKYAWNTNTCYKLVISKIKPRANYILNAEDRFCELSWQYLMRNARNKSCHEQTDAQREITFTTVVLNMKENLAGQSRNLGGRLHCLFPINVNLCLVKIISLTSDKKKLMAVV